MDLQNGRELCNLAQKLGLVTSDQVREALELLGTASPSVEATSQQLQRSSAITAWQAGKLVKGETTGYIMGGYKLLYKISSGSFGRVYRAEEPGGGRIVAVKILRRRHSEDKQRIDLFNREGKVGLMLKHPGIVEVLAVNQDKDTGQYYLVMEFVEGGNLREVMKIRKRFSPQEAMKILQDCVEGLTFAYGKGYTHRDIKLTNILISGAGQAKLVDFGLAQYFQADGRDEADERVERTVDYAGLEKATDVKQGDVRSDIFFLGCVMYEILTGMKPLELARGQRARMQKSRFDALKPLSQGDLPGFPMVVDLVNTMTALLPENRFQTPAQLLEAVKRVRRQIDPALQKVAAAGTGAKVQQTLFIVERDEKLQEVLRAKFRELGYRVLMAIDPDRAVERFRQTPFEAAIIDAGTVGESSLQQTRSLLQDAARTHKRLGIAVILSEEQAPFASAFEKDPNVKTLVRPVTLKQLTAAVQSLGDPEPTVSQPQGG
jgi:CheY-like chemotaxis protein/tRNA A-37 threonylcarbamoyl transferase component Bud32